MTFVADLIRSSRSRALVQRSALCLAFALGVASCADEEVPNSSGSDGAGADDDESEDDTADDDSPDDDAADDDGEDDDEADDDVEAPDVDAGAKRDGGPSPTRDAGKLDAALPTTAGDAGVPDASKGSTSGTKRDASVLLDAAADASAPSEDAAAPSGELCELKPYQVGIMGDSYIHLSGDFTRLLEENARKAGALGAREEYIDRAWSGAAMQKDNLLAKAIPTQLPQVLADSMRAGPDGLKLIIMTGGGNDVLIDNMECRRLTGEVTAQCKEVVYASLMVIKKLFADMKAAGIQEVIYFWYPDLGVGTGKVINDWSIPLAKEACDGNTDVRCHFVDTRDGFRGHPEYVKSDTIHPTTAGSKVIADLVWDVMVENCLASK